MQLPFEQICPGAQVTPAHGFETHWPPTQLWPLPQVTFMHGLVVGTQPA